MRGEATGFPEKTVWIIMMVLPMLGWRIFQVLKSAYPRRYPVVMTSTNAQDHPRKEPV
ncbi:MAG: hypothetical protein ACOC8N_07885 [Spirochaetota bacterium]